MIARLAGVLLEKSPERIVVDVHGIGYEVRIPLSTVARLPEVGTSVEMLIHTHVREDSLTLYGFRTALERSLFERMISVSGVGPKLALALLSGMTPAQLVDSILAGTTAPLCSVPGVGRKTAERLVVDLRDKLGHLLAGHPEGSRSSAAPPGKGGDGELLEDVHSALLNLGYSAREADRAMEDARKTALPAGGAPEEMSFQGMLRRALRSAAALR
jgi:Holliday junction DNA helicase RuvA